MVRVRVRFRVSYRVRVRVRVGVRVRVRVRERVSVLVVRLARQDTTRQDIILTPNIKQNMMQHKYTQQDKTRYNKARQDKI